MEKSWRISGWQKSGRKWKTKQLEMSVRESDKIQILEEEEAEGFQTTPAVPDRESCAESRRRA